MKAVLRRAMGHWAVRLTVTAILLGLIVWRSQPGRLLPAAGKLGSANLILAALLTVPFLYLKTLRWLYMLRYAGTEVSFGEAATSLVGGMGVALLTPARVGEVARIAYLRDPRKLRLSALVMLDKFFDVLVLVLLAISGAWQILGWEAGAALSVIGAGGLVFTFFPQLFEGLVARIERRAPLGGRTHEVFSSLESLFPTATALYIALTLGSFVLVIIQFWLIIHGAAHVSAGVAASTFPLVILTNVVPLTIAGLGIREATAVVLLGHYHVAASIAFVSAFTMFFLNTAIPGIVGATIPIFRRALPQAVQRDNAAHSDSSAH